MSEPARPPRPGRGGRSRPSPASLGVVRVDADFEDEYPGGDTTCTEAYASLCRTGEALLGELDRRIATTFDMPQTAATALAVIDGAAAPLTPSQVSDRVLVASATMTATLDLLEYRGWIRRMPNPADRRSVLIEITPAGRASADQLLPGIRAIERSILSALTQTNGHTCWTCSPRSWPGQPRSPPSNPNLSTASASAPPGSASPGNLPDQRHNPARCSRRPGISTPATAPPRCHCRQAWTAVGFMSRPERYRRAGRVRAEVGPACPGSWPCSSCSRSIWRYVLW